MKKLLSIILAISIALAAPAKATTPAEPKTLVGLALVTTGLVAAYFTAKLWQDSENYKAKLINKTQQRSFDYKNAVEKQKNILSRMNWSVATGCFSFATLGTGTAFLIHQFSKNS
jgi:hypothetical protein